MSKKKIRKEIKYSDDEWNRVIELSAKSGKLPAAYIREQALSIPIKNIGHLAINEIFIDKRNKLFWGMNEIAKTVNTEKEVFSKDVEDAEKIINELGALAHNGLKSIPMTEVKL